MKTKNYLASSLALSVLALSTLGASQASAATIITAGSQTTVSQLPGSADEYDFLDTSSKHLTDFSDSISGQHLGNQGGTLYSPAGSDPMGSGPGGSDLVATDGFFDFTLTFTTGSTSGTLLNGGDFNAYVLIGNTPNFASLETSSLTLTSGSSTATVNVIPYTQSSTTGQLIEFTISGASTSQTFQLTGTGHFSGGPLTGADLGAISFGPATVPEPSTWALLSLGLVGLLALQRRTRTDS